LAAALQLLMVVSPHLVLMSPHLIESLTRISRHPHGKLQHLHASAQISTRYIWQHGAPSSLASGPTSRMACCCWRCSQRRPPKQVLDGLPSVTSHIQSNSLLQARKVYITRTHALGVLGAGAGNIYPRALHAAFKRPVLLPAHVVCTAKSERNVKAFNQSLSGWPAHFNDSVEFNIGPVAAANGKPSITGRLLWGPQQPRL
jgi:hypothetical protein